MGVLARAELLLQAKNYSGSGDWLDEANSHDAQLGSTSGADTNDPLFLAHTGTQYLYLPGIAGNYASVPDIAAYTVTDIDVRVDVAKADYNSGATQFMIANSWSASPRAWELSINATEDLDFVWDQAGAPGAKAHTRTIAGLFSAYERVQFRATLDVDDGAGGHLSTSYYRTDGLIGSPTGWTQLGTSQGGGAGTTSIEDGAAGVSVGGNYNGTSQMFDGHIYRAQVYDGIAGTLIFDADFTDVNAVKEPFATFTEASSNAATVTINRAATGRKATVVDSARMLRGTDDYHEIPDDPGLDFAAADSFTLMSRTRAYDVTPGADMLIIAKKADLTTSAGYAFYVDTTGVPTFVIDDGTNPPTEATGPALTDGQSHVVTAVRDVAADDITVFTDGVAGTPVTDSTVLTLANAEVLRYGRLSGAGTNYADSETSGEVVWREALSDADVLRAGLELQVGRRPIFLLGISPAIAK